MNKQCKDNWIFTGKVFRNALILSGLYLVSVLAATDKILWVHLKPLLIFFLGYVCTELANKFGLGALIPTIKNKKGSATLIY